MKEKIREAIFKLKNTKIMVTTAYLYYKSIFGCRIIHLSQQQEYVLKKIYELVILRKLRLSENFQRAMLYSRKTALEIGLLTPATIINILAMKLYLRHMRANYQISKVIQINEDNTRLQYGYSKSIVDIDRQKS